MYACTHTHTHTHSLTLSLSLSLSLSVSLYTHTHTHTHTHTKTNVIVPSYAIHHLEREWKEPFTVKPERFTRKNAKGRHNCAFMPFSFGKRNCIGNICVCVCVCVYVYVCVCERERERERERTVIVWLLCNKLIGRWHCSHTMKHNNIINTTNK